MSTAYQLAIYAIIIEFVLIAMTIIITYALYVIYYLKERRQKILKMKIMHFLSNLISEKITLSPQFFPKSWKNIEVLVPALNRFSRLINTMHWQDKRMQFIRTILLPIARQSTLSNNWVLRFFAAESFALIAEKIDEEFIVKLANDNVRLVYLASIKAAIECKSEIALNNIITRMISEPRITQTTYLQAFDKVSADTRPIIVKHLLGTTDPNARATCYRILLKYPPEKIDWDISSDLLSENLTLKLVTIRFATLVKETFVIPFLITFLNDPSWEIRAVSIQCLRDLNAVEAIPAIMNNLNDSNWWVQIISKQVLKEFVDSGYTELKDVDLKVDTEVVNVMQYVINTL